MDSRAGLSRRMANSKRGMESRKCRKERLLVRAAGVAFDFQAVVPECDAWRERGRHLVCRRHFVADMGYPGLFRPEDFDQGERFRQAEVGAVRALAQGVDDEESRAGDLVELVGIDGFDIRKVGDFAEAKAQDGQAAVPDADRPHAYAADVEGGVFVDGMEFDARQAGDRVAENVFETFAYIGGNAFLGVYRHGVARAEIERPDIVEPDDVVVVFVREQNGIEVPGAGAEHLLPEIGACVDQDVRVAVRQQGGSAQAGVVRVVRSTHAAVASDNWNTLGSTGAEQCEFQRVRFNSLKFILDTQIFNPGFPGDAWRRYAPVKPPRIPDIPAVRARLCLRRFPRTATATATATAFPPFSDQRSGWFGQFFRFEFEFGQDIEQAVNPGFRVEKFVQNSDFPVLDNAVAALKVSFFIADRVVEFMKQLFQFFQRCLSVAHKHSIFAAAAGFAATGGKPPVAANRRRSRPLPRKSIQKLLLCESSSSTRIPAAVC